MACDKCVIFGLGYIGLPTATLLAGHGMDVLGVDVSDKAVDSVNAGKMHIVEPGLDVYLKEAVEKGKLRASKSPEQADVFVLAVPTPFRDGYKPDLSYIEAAAKNLAPVLKKGDLVILESTSPVGTTEQLARWLAGARPDLTFPDQAGEEADIQVAHCPERVLPGKVVHEMVENDRIIGGLTPKAARMASDFYRTFVKGDIILTNARTAEMCKLTENSFRDVNIAFANELSILCDKLGINVWELIELANRHPRVNILNPGCGVGGHCIAVDPWFIVDQCPDEARIIAAARNVNDGKADYVTEKIREAIRKIASERNISENQVTIACLGLAFKPDIDDLRESPAVKIVKKLAADFPGQVIAVEPNITTLPEKLKKENVKLVSLKDALKADAIALLVPHKPFMDLELPKQGLFMDFTGIIKGRA